MMKPDNTGHLRERLRNTGVVMIEEEYLLGRYPKEIARQSRDYVAREKEYIREKIRGEAFEHEYGIVAKPLLPSPFKADIPLEAPIKHKGLSHVREIIDKVSLEKGRAPFTGHPAQLPEKPVYPLSIVRSVPRGADAGCCPGALPPRALNHRRVS